MLVLHVLMIVEDDIIDRDSSLIIHEDLTTILLLEEIF